MTQSFGKKVSTFQRFAKMERNAGQARVPGRIYVAHSFEYDVSVAGAADAFVVGLVVALDAASDKIAPYVKGDAKWGTPLGVILEPSDLETDINVSVYVQGTWDTDVIPVVGLDISDAAELRKLNATNYHGTLTWNLTMPPVGA
ncbi:hypothetical protein Dxin01_00187 [Deinococcus xinjiangensis]|uniref:Uncharacterized protein n=1 Tax=Deinococcus xinjiangensis TaxID=457454 RepID=A0ABP9V753_9DEIO